MLIGQFVDPNRLGRTVLPTINAGLSAFITALASFLALVHRPKAAHRADLTVVSGRIRPLLLPIVADGLGCKRVPQLFHCSFVLFREQELQRLPSMRISNYNARR